VAAVHGVVDASDEARLVGGQEHRHGDDILRLAEAADRLCDINMALTSGLFICSAVPGVMIAPGLMATTRIPWGAPSTAS
jgi:ABC-type nickel/cobalt efflux system permease component RcnA